MRSLQIAEGVLEFGRTIRPGVLDGGPWPDEKAEGGGGLFAPLGAEGVTTDIIGSPVADDEGRALVPKATGSPVVRNEVVRGDLITELFGNWE